MPKQRIVTVRRPDRIPHVLGLNDVLDGGDVVPGFRCTVRRIFE